MGGIDPEFRGSLGNVHVYGLGWGLGPEWCPPVVRFLVDDLEQETPPRKCTEPRDECTGEEALQEGLVGLMSPGKRVLSEISGTE